MILENKITKDIRFFGAAIDENDNIHLVKLGLHQGGCGMARSPCVKHSAVCIKKGQRDGA